MGTEQPMNAPPAVIVLGAGRGSRFGGVDHKLVQSIGTSTVFGSTLRHAVASLLPVVVVTTAALAELARLTVAARDIVVVPEVGSVPGATHAAARTLGMGYSISVGVAERADAGGWLVLPADMPLVSPASLQAVAQALASHPVVYAQYKGRRGHPVGFSSELYSELVGLSGDEGARRLIARYPAFGLEVDDPGVLIDVDTPADLDRVRRHDLPAAVREARW